MANENTPIEDGGTATAHDEPMSVGDDKHPIRRRYELRAKNLLKEYRQLRRNKVAIAGLYFIWVMIAVAIFAPLIAPYDPASQGVGQNLAPPSIAHPFGTDHFGRDILSRTIYGARISIAVGFIAVGEALVLGVATGLVAGYVGGKTDAVIMRIMDAIFAFPVLVLAIGIVAILGASMVNIMLAVGIRYIPVFARVTRGEVLSIKEKEYVEASRLIGASRRRILFKEILPNTLSPVIVTGTILVAYAILAEAGLSFLGLGVQPPRTSWGLMLTEGQTYIRVAPWMAIFPGLALVFTVLAVNLLGDGLRDIFDPEMRGEA